MLHTTKKNSILFARELTEAHINESEETKIKLKGAGVETLEALFLGTHGTNAVLMQELMMLAVKGHVDFRNSYFPGDPDYVDATVQKSPGFISTMVTMGYEYEKLINKLKESGAFFSMRTVGHMLWDCTIPGILGYFAALLYNQNNVAVEASPVTTLLEMHVGNELCKMLGYSVHPIGMKAGEFKIAANQITGWGHITCDGSVANAEGLWMARNLKFYPVSVKAALINEPGLQAAKNYTIKLLNGSMAKLIDLDSWTILNLPIDEVLAIAENISTQYNIDPTVFGNLVTNYTVQSIGYHDILTKYLPDIKTTPVSLCSATRHYSWPKGAAILGIGANNMISIPVDLKARMSMPHLKSQLDLCIQQKIPVMNVVAIIGTTEESAVDRLDDLLTIRDTYRKLGLEFAIHADAAWGGYFAAMLNSADESDPTAFKLLDEAAMAQLPMSDHDINQYKSLKFADSITIDPHKAGYVPYPAGGLCYRNSAMRNLVSFTAPVIYHSTVDPTVGIYGVEGSKPGAAAAAVYFSHKVIRPNTDGYGKLLGECLFNAKRLYAALVCLNIQKLPFFVEMLVPIPAVQNGESPANIQKQYEFIRDRIVNKTNQQLQADTEAFTLFKKLGGDQTILTYMYNFYNSDGLKNSDIVKLNKLNTAVYQKFSFKAPIPGSPLPIPPEIVVTSSSFTLENYGHELMDNLRKRLGIVGGKDQPIDFIISTIMNPWLSHTLKGSFIPEIISIIVKKCNSTYSRNKKLKQNLKQNLKNKYYDSKKYFWRKH